MKRKGAMMSGKAKNTHYEKEQKLLQKIEEAKKELQKLQQKRRLEIGQLACKHGLDQLDNQRLDELFGQLAQQHAS